MKANKNKSTNVTFTMNQNIKLVIMSTIVKR
jgi:hypothetical protein